MKKMMSFIILFALCTCLYKPVIHVSSSQLLNQRVIVLDPGHGGLDNGASIAGVDEDELNLKISFALKEELESRGATVYMTRTDDQDMTRRNYNYSKQDDMYLRALKIDEYHPDLFLSIHLNSSNSSAWGSQVFYYKKSEDGKRLADSIHNQIIVDDPSIVNDPDIPISKRPDCTILTFADRIVILFKNNSIEEKCSPIVYEITEKISSKNPDKLIAAINFNEFEN